MATHTLHPGALLDDLFLRLNMHDREDIFLQFFDDKCFSCVITEWFEGLSHNFLTCSASKLLLLAGWSVYIFMYYH